MKTYLKLNLLSPPSKLDKKIHHLIVDIIILLIKKDYCLSQCLHELLCSVNCSVQMFLEYLTFLLVLCLLYKNSYIVLLHNTKYVFIIYHLSVILLYNTYIQYDIYIYYTKYFVFHNKVYSFYVIKRSISRCRNNKLIINLLINSSKLYSYTITSFYYCLITMIYQVYKETLFFYTNTLNCKIMYLLFFGVYNALKIYSPIIRYILNIICEYNTNILYTICNIIRIRR